jgi:hypothetical protein
MAKRGRPKTVSNDIHVARYYIPNTRIDDGVRFKAMEERAYKAYEELYFLAYGEPIGLHHGNRVKRGISAILERQ